MERKPETDSPLVCNLDAMDNEQRNRYRAVLDQLRKSVQEIRELSTGYAFRHLSDTSTILLVAEFITLERLCCPFLDFALEIEREGGPLWFRMTGPEGVKHFLRAELGFE